jgi:hypothetical protein
MEGNWFKVLSQHWSRETLENNEVPQDGRNPDRDSNQAPPHPNLSHKRHHSCSQFHDRSTSFEFEHIAIIFRGKIDRAAGLVTGAHPHETRHPLQIIFGDVFSEVPFPLPLRGRLPASDDIVTLTLWTRLCYPQRDEETERHIFPLNYCIRQKTV